MSQICMSISHMAVGAAAVILTHPTHVCSLMQSVRAPTAVAHNNWQHITHAYSSSNKHKTESLGIL